MNTFVRTRLSLPCRSSLWRSRGRILCDRASQHERMLHDGGHRRRGDGHIGNCARTDRGRGCRRRRRSATSHTPRAGGTSQPCRGCWCWLSRWADAGQETRGFLSQLARARDSFDETSGRTGMEATLGCHLRVCCCESCRFAEHAREPLRRREGLFAT